MNLKSSEKPPRTGRVIYGDGTVRCSGKYLRRWRTNLGLSYEDVASALGVTSWTVRNWERKKRLKKVVKLAFDRVFRKESKQPRWVKGVARITRTGRMTDSDMRRMHGG